MGKTAMKGFESVSILSLFTTLCLFKGNTILMIQRAGIKKETIDGQEGEGRKGRELSVHLVSQTIGSAASTESQRS